MKFNYELSGCGWARGFISNENHDYCFGASSICDSLECLLKTLLELYFEAVPDGSINSRRIVELYEEPGGSLWSFELIENKKIKIIIIAYEDLDNKENGKIVFKEVCELGYFLVLIMDSLETLLNKHGLIGYKDSWDYEFPIAHFLKLKHIQTSSNIFPSMYSQLDPVNLVFSDLEGEIRFIQSLFEK
jgi:hypothetical protein